MWSANQSARKTVSTVLVYTNKDYHALPPRIYSSVCNAARRTSQEKKWWLWYKGTGQWLNDRFGFRGVDFARILERSLNYVIGTSRVLILAMSIGKYDVMCSQGWPGISVFAVNLVYKAGKGIHLCPLPPPLLTASSVLQAFLPCPNQPSAHGYDLADRLADQSKTQK